jgi:hypothetical protein
MPIRDVGNAGPQDRLLTLPLHNPAQVSFVRNREGDVIYDRAFNTASLLAHYYKG